MKELSCPLCDSKLSSTVHTKVMKKYEKEANEKNAKMVKNMEEKHEQSLKSEIDKVRKEESQKQDNEMAKQVGEISELSVMKLNLEKELNEIKKEMNLKDKQFDAYKNKTESKSAYLKGATGEMALLQTLKSAFPDDDFTVQTTGNEMADIVQRVYTGNGFLDTTICYDNKAGKTITVTDRAKIQKYKSIHNTSHVMIVSSHLPAKSNQGVVYVDDVLLVHPFVVTEVTGIIRRHLLEVSRIAKSGVDRNKKEAVLYEYMMSDSFRNQMNLIYVSYKKLDTLQKKEENDHNNMWKKRKHEFSLALKNIQLMEANINEISENESSPFNTTKVKG